jgi:hypothetical protein
VSITTGDALDGTVGGIVLAAGSASSPAAATLGGAIRLAAGAGANAGAGGAVVLSAGAAAGAGAGGSVSITPGASASGSAGTIELTSSAGTTLLQVGDGLVASGTGLTEVDLTATGSPGRITLTADGGSAKVTGATAELKAMTGAAKLYTAGTTGSSDSGSVLVFSGAVPNGQTAGSVSVYAGDATGTGTGGSVVLQPGSAGIGGTAGVLRLLSSGGEAGVQLSAAGGLQLGATGAGVRKLVLTATTAASASVTISGSASSAYAYLIVQHVGTAALVPTYVDMVDGMLVLLLNDSDDALTITGTTVLYSATMQTIAARSMAWFITISCGGTGDACKLVGV